jgi:hypothetical protein
MMNSSFEEHALQKYVASMHEEALRLYGTKCSEAIIQFLRMPISIYCTIILALFSNSHKYENSKNKAPNSYVILSCRYKTNTYQIL